MVRRELATFGPDVVHAHQPMAPSTGLWATLEARAPVVGTFHSGATRARLYDLAAPLLRRAASPSDGADRGVRARGGLRARAGSAGTFRIIPNGVDVARFADAAPADLGAGPQAAVRRQARRAQGVPGRDRGVRAAGRRRGPTCAWSSWAMGRNATRSTDCRRCSGRASRCSAPCPTRTAADRTRRATCTSVRRPVARSSASCWSRRWRPGCRSWRATSPGYDEVVTDGVDGSARPAPRPGRARGRGRARPGRCRAGRAPAAAGRARAATFDWSVVVGRSRTPTGDALEIGASPLR